MKLSGKIHALLLTVFVAGTCYAQSPDYSVFLTVISNSNSPAQDMMQFVNFLPNGASDSLDAFDNGNESFIPAGTQDVYSFTQSATGDVITLSDARPLLTTYKYIDFGFYSASAATITFTTEIVANNLVLDTNFCDPDNPTGPSYIYLEQRSTGAVWFIVDDTITLNIPANTSFASDFRLHLGPNIVSHEFPETCYNTQDGHIDVRNMFSNDWNLSLYRNGSLYRDIHVSNPDTTFSNLPSGQYAVVTRMNNIMVDSDLVWVLGQAPVLAGFNASTYMPMQNTVVAFTNTSAGATNYHWNFGDGNESADSDASHAYAAAGDYTVTLTVTNANGCTETATTLLNVLPALPVTVGNPAPSRSNSTSFDAHRNQQPEATVVAGPQKITITQVNEQPLTIEVLTADGRLVSSTQTADASFALSIPQPGIYFVRMSASNGQLTSKTVFVSE